MDCDFTCCSYNYSSLLKKIGNCSSYIVLISLWISGFLISFTVAHEILLVPIVESRRDSKSVSNVIQRNLPLNRAVSPRLLYLLITLHQNHVRDRKSVPKILKPEGLAWCVYRSTHMIIRRPEILTVVTSSSFLFCWIL